MQMDINKLVDLLKKKLGQSEMDKAMLELQVAHLQEIIESTEVADKEVTD